jgi:hypothetical protein
MRPSGICIILFVSACGLSLLAQEPANQPPASTPPAADSKDNSQPPLTPEEERAQQIRQFDPLAPPEVDKDAEAREKANREAEKRRDQAKTPTPGSIAATERDQVLAGPRVSDEDSAETEDQDYTGPAVLSRSYSVNRPLIPQELTWKYSLGASAVFDTGVTKVLTSDGSLTNANLAGSQARWTLVGRHVFRHDQIAVSYSGDYSHYSGPSGYNGGNEQLTVDYTHVFTRRLKLNVAGSGQMLSQNYILNNQDTGPNTIANINLSTSPNIEITDEGVKQFYITADGTWQKTTRLSFNVGGSYFAVERDAPGLLGTTGQQARGDVNYRLTSKMTTGAYYSFNYYLYPQGYGTGAVSSFGGIYSYAFSRTMQLRLRGGVSYVQNRAFETVSVPPSIAALTGQTAGIIDDYTSLVTNDISAQLVKDFSAGKTASIAYAHGISPGNGLFLTSQQQSIAVRVMSPFRRLYTVSAGFGQDILTSVAQSIGKYQSEYATLSINRNLNRSVSLNLQAEFRHFDVQDFYAARNQLRITSGIVWGSTNGRLWPF